MSDTPSAEEQELLESIRAGLRESVAFWAPENKVKREIYAVDKLLEHLGVPHEGCEVLPAASEPPDIHFRDARFEVKEAMDEGRRRHDEYRIKLEKAEKAVCVHEVMEQYTPKDLTFEEIGTRVVKVLQQESTHYARRVIESLDLLIYVNLLERIVVMDSAVPDASTFAPYGWRSVSIVKGSVSCVLHARPDAPAFLRERVGRPFIQVSVE